MTYVCTSIYVTNRITKKNHFKDVLQVFHIIHMFITSTQCRRFCMKEWVMNNERVNVGEDVECLSYTTYYRKRSTSWNERCCHGFCWKYLHIYRYYYFCWVVGYRYNKTGRYEKGYTESFIWFAMQLFISTSWKLYWNLSLRFKAKRIILSCKNLMYMIPYQIYHITFIAGD